MLYFSELATTGSSKHLNVYKGIKAKPNHNSHNKLNGKTVKTQIGRISYTTGKFYYYEPPTNTIKPILIDEDLEILKNKVINRRNG
jgi:hypothetical protein